MVNISIGNKSRGQKLLSTGYKIHGWGLKAKAISNFIIGGASFVLGIVLVISVSFPFILVSVLGLILIFAGWLYWKRSNSLVKGRFF